MLPFTVMILLAAFFLATMMSGGWLVCCIEENALDAGIAISLNREA